MPNWQAFGFQDTFDMNINYIQVSQIFKTVNEIVKKTKKPLRMIFLKNKYTFSNDRIAHWLLTKKQVSEYR